MRQGDIVETTCCGKGKIIWYREMDRIYQIQLEWGTLYGPHTSFTLPKKKEHQEPLSAKTTSTTTGKDDSNCMELNVAYEALEQMRINHIELLCQERKIPSYHHQECHDCLLSRAATTSATTATTTSATAAATEENNNGGLLLMNGTSTSSSIIIQKQQQQKFPRLRRLVQHAKTKLQTPKKSQQCLVCGNPVCRQHASQAFRKEGINLCCHCETLFGLDFVIDILSKEDANARKQHFDKLMDIYDRVQLLLKYSAQNNIIDDIADSLEQSTKQQNHIGITSSSAGIVSGVLGVASAITLLTPAGPPLLIASLLFGGSATAVQTGSDVKQHYSQPNQIADRILALHGIAWSILKVVSVLRDAILRDHLRIDVYDTPQGDDVVITKQASYKNAALLLQKEKQTNLVTNASTMATLGLAGTLESSQVGAAAEAATKLAGRNARFMSRSGTAAMRTIRFARFAGGSLAAATLLLEARSLNTTLQSIRNGHPCENAETLRQIKNEIVGCDATKPIDDDNKDDEMMSGWTFPTTSDLDAECRRYLETLNHRHVALTEADVKQLLWENGEIDDHQQQQDEEVIIEEQAEEPEKQGKGPSITEFV